MAGKFIVLMGVLLFFSCQPSVRYSREAGARSANTSSGRLNFFVQDWLHTPYKYGGTGKNGIDCSGFAARLMQDVYGIKIPRQAQEQYRQGEKIARFRLQPGDLVFFSTRRNRNIDHVGVYMGDDRFAHATESDGVIISNLQEDYYSARYTGACRY